MSVKTLVSTVGLLAVLLATLALPAYSQGKQAGKQQGRIIDTQGSKTLDFNEQTHLEYMREEEKLARDVYIALGVRYPAMKIFGNIDDAEQRHTCAVCDMLKKYGVEDPNTNDNVGVFTGSDFGTYFTAQYTDLVSRGSSNPIDALYVGAYIEEMDMIDINYCPEEIIQQKNGISSESDCGKIYSDNPDIQRLYTSLLQGSENHLRAFVRSIERRQGEGSYQAQVLTQDQVDAILRR
jgi:hypothetical protein